MCYHTITLKGVIVLTTAERIKRRRMELNLSVEELATKLGKNRATVYRYENGDIENMPLSVLKPLATALETTPVELMGWSEGRDEEDKMGFIADAIDIIESEGFSVHSYDNENGIGNEYVVEKRDLNAIPPMQE